MNFIERERASGMGACCAPCANRETAPIARTLGGVVRSRRSMGELTPAAKKKCPPAAYVVYGLGGAVSGGVLGAILGALVGTPEARGKAALVGGAIGGVVTGAIGVASVAMICSAIDDATATADAKGATDTNP